MKHSFSRCLAYLVFAACSFATACSFQVPNEDKVFSNIAVGGQASGGIDGNGGNSRGTGGRSSGGTSSANGGNAGLGGTAFTSGGLAGASSSIGGTGANVGGVGPNSGGTAGTANTATVLGGAGAATGGKTGVGGTVSGGAPNSTSTGGSPAAGGTGAGVATGGAIATGGTKGTGGATSGTSSTGGNIGAGGTTNANPTGGSPSNGGTAGSSASDVTGGAVAVGGSTQGGAAGTGGTTALATGGSADVLSVGLVHYYKFDETMGTVAADSIDPTKNGTYMGNSSHPSGRFGKAVAFRNSATPPDYVELATGLFTGLAATTISIWFADYSTSRRGARAFDFGTGDPTSIFFIPHMSNPSTLTDAALVSVRLGGLTNAQLWDNVNLADSNSTATIWHHMAVTWSVDALTFYIDGVLIGTQASPGVLPSDLNPTAPNWLGRTFGDTAPLMYASLDDLRIYDRVLPLLYIQNLYNML